MAQPRKRYATIPACNLPAPLVAHTEPDEFYYCLIEFVGDEPVRIVGTDGGEPEDQTFTRDWAWVAVELNMQAARIAELEQLAEIGRKAVEWLNPTPGVPNTAREELETLSAPQLSIVKTCVCGRQYDAVTWLTLHSVGVLNFEDGRVMESRHCTCGSTISIWLAGKEKKGS